MNILILLHSTTGNTRLVTRHAAMTLRAAGHRCTVHNIVKEPAPPDLGAVDLLGVAAPTMYCRQTFAMEQFLDRLPPGPGRPAFLLGTCAGEPGAHFALQAEQLAARGFVVLGAHWVMAPLNIATDAFPGATTVGRTMDRFPRATRTIGALLGLYHPVLSALLSVGGMRLLRGTASMISLDLGVPDARDRRALERFLEQMARQAMAGDLDHVPRPNALHRAIPPFNFLGRVFRQSLLNSDYFRVQIDERRCNMCSTCVKVCPVRTITQQEGQVPRVGTNCGGCFACFNYCPEGAVNISGLILAGSGGRGQYKGPPRAMRAVFG